MPSQANSRSHRLRLRSGEFVEVRTKQEILSTLDRDGRLDQMPFMPEMLKYCGKRFRVAKRAHKTCDPVHGLEGRRLERAVHLEALRCDGTAHGGCEAGCLLFWKEAWLRRVDESPLGSGTVAHPTGSGDLVCTEEGLHEATKAVADAVDNDDDVYVCQATKVKDSTSPIKWWDVRQYVEDIQSGNVGVSRLIKTFSYFVVQSLAESGFGLGTLIRWTYERVQVLRGGAAYPVRRGQVPKGTRTPSERLELQPGEMVRMKSYSEILRTLDVNWRNRGLYFDSEMVPYCNGTYRVQKRVQRIIDEKTGIMLHFNSDVILLEGVVCQARYAKYRKFCPRAYYQYAREIWLERVQR